MKERKFIPWDITQHPSLQLCSKTVMEKEKEVQTGIVLGKKDLGSAVFSMFQTQVELGSST